NINLIREQMEYSILESIDKLHKMVIFNMDEAIFTEDYLLTAATEFGFSPALEELRATAKDQITLLEDTAQLFRHHNLAELLEVADGIPLIPDIKMVVKELKKRGYTCGVITDGFECVSRHVKNQ